MQPESPITTSPTGYTRPPGMFGTRIPSTVAFALAILLFFLPFVEIKCGDTPLVENTGLGIAIGTEWKPAGAMGMFGNSFNEDKSLSEMQKKQDPNIYAIIALGIGVVGLLFCFGSAKIGGLGGLVTGLISAGALIGLFFDIKGDVRTQSPPVHKAPAENDFLGMGNIGDKIAAVEFKPWFYIAVIAFLAAAIFCYMRLKNSNNPSRQN